MADNSRKTPLPRSLNSWAHRQIAAAIARQGKSLPCKVVAVSGVTVTVSFEVAESPLTLPNVSVPIAESAYVRLPVQVGDLGIVLAADTRLGIVSGLGNPGTPPNLSPPGNLSTLVYLPISNIGWAAIDSGTLLAWGPAGFILRVGGPTETTTEITATPGAITLTAGGHTLAIGSGGITLDGKVFATHAHTGVQTGASNTGPVA